MQKKEKKSETITARLDPKLKFSLELIARKQRRNLSSVIEWLLYDGLERYCMDDDGKISFAQCTKELWDVFESDRFIKLALHFPELLSYEEEKLWKIVRECDFLWKKKIQDEELVLEHTIKYLNWDRLRNEFETLKSVAVGEIDASALEQIRNEYSEGDLFSEKKM